jgi:hypothetical protein
MCRAADPGDTGKSRSLPESVDGRFHEAGLAQGVNVTAGHSRHSMKTRRHADELLTTLRAAL